VTKVFSFQYSEKNRVRLKPDGLDLARYPRSAAFVRTIRAADGAADRANSLTGKSVRLPDPIPTGALS